MHCPLSVNAQGSLMVFVRAAVHCEGGSLRRGKVARRFCKAGAGGNGGHKLRHI